MDEFYTCDPRINEDCKKEECWYYSKGMCYQTVKEDCASEHSRWRILAEIKGKA